MERGNKLGEGTFGIVYEATSIKSEEKLAVKRNLVDSTSSFIGAAREVDMLNLLRDHPYIVQLKQVAFGNPFNDTCFSPLDVKNRASQRDDMIHFVFGKAHCDLHTYIYSNPVINFREIKKYMVHILLAIEYMHYRKLIHRDIKPANVLLFEKEDSLSNKYGVAKICDFGLAKPYTYQGMQTPNTVTSWYRAPEIALGYPHYDYKSDVWSLGCTFYELIARRPFIYGAQDDNDDIISTILANLPLALPMRKTRELITSNKWRQVKLLPKHIPKIRKSYYEQFGLLPQANALFETSAGKLSEFINLLDNMLTFDWEERYTVKQCLNHPFFNEYSELINLTRLEHIAPFSGDYTISLNYCIERRWMTEIVTDIFNQRDRLPWYHVRALFQAMDIFDRYISAMMDVTIVPSNFVESDLKGLLHDKSGARLRFMICLYLCIKYFTSVCPPISFDEITLGEYDNEQSKLIAQHFEGGLVMNCLQYEIYRPTIYEIADEFDDKLGEEDIMRLIVLYTSNRSISGMKLMDVYNYYRKNLKNLPIQNLLLPIQC